MFNGVLTFLNQPFEFHCFTDDANAIDSRVDVHPIPDEPFEDQLVAAMNRKGRQGAWRKISLFKPGLAGMSGPTLYFDLDVLITGVLDPLVEFAGNKIGMRREWRYERLGREGGHGSVEIFDPAQHSFLYSEFAADPEGSVQRHRGSEQYYTSMTALRHNQLRYFPGDMIRSFKRDAMRTFPSIGKPATGPRENCRVLCFHGDPKIEAAQKGHRSSLLRFTEPAPWIEKFWREPDVQAGNKPQTGNNRPAGPKQVN
ncbi:MAG: glycosyl transferase [Marinosulfonomonas sp.]|nr:glycosyl transferase [Marinosulfonomonas sp.]